METITLDATIEQLDAAQAFVRRCAQKAGLPEQAARELRLVTEELFVNIASHAYTAPGGRVTLRGEAAPGRLALTFIDTGRPFDPLKYAGGNEGTPLEERAPGGLGILLARQYSDELRYRREEEKNLVTVIKTSCGGEKSDA